MTKLQTGGEFWTTQAVSAAPAQFPAGVFTGITLENANPPGDPTQGPSGDPSNLVPAGPAGGWCRPPSLPFDQNNPLVSPALWIPAGVLLGGVRCVLVEPRYKNPLVTCSGGCICDGT